MNRKINSSSDLVGVAAGGICALHCMATPFLFIAETCSSTEINRCCQSSPGWWNSIDYFFIGISFFAVYHSSKNSTKAWLKYALFGAWGILSFFLLNGQIIFLNISESWKYLTAFVLISLHLYNLKFCRCTEASS